MLVTLPFVLLLLDYWPLERLSIETILTRCAGPRSAAGSRWSTPLVLEKLPLFALAIAAAVVTYVVQESARGSLSHLPVWSRVANALNSYVAYLWKFVYPAQLAVFYPHPGDALPSWRIAGACLVLGLVSAAALIWRRRHPYLLVGWLWYLGMLVPVIGLVQVGSQAMADRYTYLTQIGLYIAVAWGAMHLAGTSPSRRRMCGVGACVVILILSAAPRGRSRTGRTARRSGVTRWSPRRQIMKPTTISPGRWPCAERLTRPSVITGRRWRSGQTSSRRTTISATCWRLAATMRPPSQHYRTALNIKPDYVEARNNLGLALAEAGQLEAAIAEYRRALAFDPTSPPLTTTWATRSRLATTVDGAIAHYDKALDVRPDFAEVHNNYGTLLAARGQADAAIAHYQRALAINPQFASARRNLALVLAERNGS